MQRKVNVVEDLDGNKYNRTHKVLMPKIPHSLFATALSQLKKKYF